MLEVEEGQIHQLFVVLKFIPYLAKNVVRNVAVDLVVVCANVSFCWLPSRSGLIELIKPASHSLNVVTKILHPCQTQLCSIAKITSDYSKMPLNV